MRRWHFLHYYPIIHRVLPQWDRTVRENKHGVWFYHNSSPKLMWEWKLIWEKRGHKRYQSVVRRLNSNRNRLQKRTFLSMWDQLNQHFCEPICNHCITTPSYPRCRENTGATLSPVTFKLKNSKFESQFRVITPLFSIHVAGIYCCNFSLSFLQQFCWVHHYVWLKSPKAWVSLH